MPVIMPGIKAPILLKRVIRTGRINLRNFCQNMHKETGIYISKTSLTRILDYGMVLKRYPDFQNKICAAVGKVYGDLLEELEIAPEDLWKEESMAPPLSAAHEEKLHFEKIKKLTEVTMLTKNTMAYFGLKSSPFTLDIRKESDIFLSTSHLYALEVMREAAEYGGFAVVTGQVGSGKSTIFSKFLEETRINNKYQIIFPEAIDKTRLNACQILQACVYDLSESPAKTNMEALSRQVKTLLTKRAANSDRTVLVIEEAHDLPTNTLKYLKRLWELKNGLQRLMGIILIGQNELETRLYGKANTEIREVTARTTHARVEPIENEIGEYIAYRIKSAGGNVERIICPDAIEALSLCLTLEDRHGKKQSLAYPLIINNAMNKLMNFAADCGEELITPEIIRMAGI